jgi:tetratricopeptide (TPR) repeat protein
MADVVLVMIVKNESRIIERCLNSAKDIISSFSIVDTGSTDKTVEIIKNWGLDNNMKGQVIERPWKNFGHNRTESFIEAKKYVIENGFNISKTFALFIDADMILKKLPKYNKQHLLKNKGFQLKQIHNNLFYYNLRLALFESDWQCVGVTHEFWSASGVDSESYDYLEIDDREDGGAKADKFQRDEMLLIQGLVDEPNNGRYMFYLAQTYWCLGQYEKSITWYKKRVDLGGWYEETWYSHYKLVENYIKLDKPMEAIEWCFKGYHYYPKRTEAFNILCKYLRDLGNNNLCYFISNFAENIKLPNDKLFMEDDVYKYKFTEHKSISAYYCNKIKEGYESCENLLKTIEYPNKQLTIQNEFFYIQSVTHNDIKHKKIDSSLIAISDKDTTVEIILDKLYIGNIYNDIRKEILTDTNLLNSLSIFYFDKNNVIVNLVGNKYMYINISNSSYVIKNGNIFPVNTINTKKELITKNHIVADKCNIINYNDVEVCSLLFSNLYNTFPQTNGIDFNKGHLFVLQVKCPDQNRYYTRFLWTSMNYTYKKHSKMVFFKDRGEDEILNIVKKNESVLFVMKNRVNNQINIFTVNDNEIERQLSESI